ncbi:MAG TPA: PRC-barrel domain-containing protein [Thermoleophilia bacterium]|nr:PRC-barrel domain-containing protein [Thermoleophilia bacterium]
MTTSGLWACGSLGRVHGLKGEQYLNLYPGGLEYLHRGTRFWVAGAGSDAADAPESPSECLLLHIGGTDRRPLVRLDLAESREQAIALQGCELLASGDELDAIPHYSYTDLIGLRVETTGGRFLGTIRDIVLTPAHEVLEITAPGENTVLVPLVDELVAVDAEAGVARVIDGLLDDETTSG